MKISVLAAVAVAALAGPAAASNGKAVFAHFIVGNVLSSYDLAQWESDVAAAKASGIMGFVLNMAPPYDDTLRTQLGYAFQAAGTVGGGAFENILSFDYLGSGTPWAQADVIAALQAFGHHPAYFQYDNKPLVTTFEGTANIGDWAGIKAAVDCFLVPDWTSLGPDGFKSHLDVADGAFSWDMWPNGPHDISEVATDQGWIDAIGPSRPYMMGVSPWFSTDLAQYHKAWVWRGDSVWATRWAQVAQFQPEFIQIVTWNDYGESHYVGPVWEAGIPAGAEAYVDGYSHEHWRDLLPYHISQFLGAAAAPSTDTLVWWYRLAPGSVGTTDVTGNDCKSAVNTGGYQDCFSPGEILEDKVFFSLLATDAATVMVQIGDSAPVNHTVTGAGLQHFTQGFGGQFGSVTFTVVRDGQVVISGTGAAIADSAPNNVANWNAYVGGATAGGH